MVHTDVPHAETLCVGEGSEHVGHLVGALDSVEAGLPTLQNLGLQGLADVRPPQTRKTGHGGARGCAWTHRGQWQAAFVQ